MPLGDGSEALHFLSDALDAAIEDPACPEEGLDTAMALYADLMDEDAVFDLREPLPPGRPPGPDHEVAYALLADERDDLLRRARAAELELADTRWRKRVIAGIGFAGLFLDPVDCTNEEVLDHAEQYADTAEQMGGEAGPGVAAAMRDGIGRAREALARRQGGNRG